MGWSSKKKVTFTITHSTNFSQPNNLWYLIILQVRSSSDDWEHAKNLGDYQVIIFNGDSYIRHVDDLPKNQGPTSLKPSQNDLSKWPFVEWSMKWRCGAWGWVVQGGCFRNSGTPKSSILIKFYIMIKPSILGYPYFWKRPNGVKTSINGLINWVTCFFFTPK